jgi:drug/metabolite transporter (DMT)-like permease
MFNTSGTRTWKAWRYAVSEAATRLSDRYNPWGLTAMQIVAGSLFFIPGAFLLDRIPLEEWSLTLVLSLVFLGGFVTFGAFGLYNWGISRIRAAKASSFINLVPVVAVGMGWAVLGEALSLLQCPAACAVIAGVVLSQKTDKPKPDFS